MYNKQGRGHLKQEALQTGEQGIKKKTGRWHQNGENINSERGKQKSMTLLGEERLEGNGNGWEGMGMVGREWMGMVRRREDSLGGTKGGEWLGGIDTVETKGL